MSTVTSTTFNSIPTTGTQGVTAQPTVTAATTPTATRPLPNLSALLAMLQQLLAQLRPRAATGTTTGTTGTTQTPVTTPEVAPRGIFYDEGNFKGAFAQYNNKQTHNASNLTTAIKGFSEAAAIGRGTGTGLDSIVTTILNDPGLIAGNSSAHIRGGAYTANALNHLIAKVARDTGSDRDGTFTTDEVELISSIIKNQYEDAFLALHGNDEAGVETGYHLVQGDGGTSTLNLDGTSQNAVNTIFDGMYHIGFDIQNGTFLNEDGAANAKVTDVTNWLNTLYFKPSSTTAGEAAPLANYQNQGGFGSAFATYNGNQTHAETQLQNVMATFSQDAVAGRPTNTGLDQFVNLILKDKGLEAANAQNSTRAGAYAANGLNHLFVKVARETGADVDGKFTQDEISLISSIIKNNYPDIFIALHGNDEAGEETGYHWVQNDGATTTLNLDGQAKNAVNTIIDGFYHYGFDIKNGSFVNEDGNANATLSDVTKWVNKAYFGPIA